MEFKGNQWLEKNSIFQNAVLVFYAIFFCLSITLIVCVIIFIVFAFCRSVIVFAFIEDHFSVPKVIEHSVCESSQSEGCICIYTILTNSIALFWFRFDIHSKDDFFLNILSEILCLKFFLCISLLGFLVFVKSIYFYWNYDEMISGIT